MDGSKVSGAEVEEMYMMTGQDGMQAGSFLINIMSHMTIMKPQQT